MPIVSIPQQPASNSLNAAYRPVILRCTAQHTLPITPTTFIPPVVYCDIYFNNVFYKTLTKTQAFNKPDFAASINPLFEFDIQDAAQEYLRSELAPHGASDIYETTTETVSAYCRFRSSGYNTSGFIIAEGTAPIQGTGSKPPVAGTGTQSNGFFILNMSLQHEYNQDLATHLGYVKSNTNGAWSATDAYPASHRPKLYYIGLNDSDYYPFIYIGSRDIKCINLNYKLKNSGTYKTEKYCYCVGKIIGSNIMPNAMVGKPYFLEVAVQVDAPFMYGDGGPAWLSITVSSTKITFSGTPAATDATTIPERITVLFANCGGKITVFKSNLTVQGLPALTLISDTRTGSIFSPHRRQVFRVGPYVYAGYTYKLKLSAEPGNDAVVIAIAGDTPVTIAQKLVDAIRAKSYGTPIYTVFSSGTDITTEIRFIHRFDSEVTY